MCRIENPPKRFMLNFKGDMLIYSRLMLMFLAFMLMFSMFMIISLLPMLLFGSLCLSISLYAFLFRNMLIPSVNPEDQTVLGYTVQETR
ncbi:hypothetical protein CUU66_03640 [Peribacillus deserti]|uniref:Uncharacterized protein n=1 Tax=Peribacillus deserti TaxID=673318 RepID=A0A2N5MAC0_9BACI|nr:hypothetical protein CUU66_03640 [Peribacillus deserti]